MISTIRNFRNVHKGKSAIVCGTGSSLRNLLDYETDKVVVIGLNGAAGYCRLDYLLIKDQLNLNRKYGNPDLQRKIESIRDNACDNLFCKHPPVGYRQNNLVQYEVIPITSEIPGRVLKMNKLWGGGESFLSAISLAIYMGCECVGLVGIDWCTPDVFGDFTEKTYWMDERRDEMESVLAKMMDWARSNDIFIVNLSNRTKVRSIPTLELSVFMEMA